MESIDSKRKIQKFSVKEWWQMAEFLSLGVLVNQVTAPAQRGILHNVRRTAAAAAVPVAWLFHAYFTHFLFSHSWPRKRRRRWRCAIGREKKRESPSLVPGKAKKAGLYTQSNWRVLTKGRGEKINKTEKENTRRRRRSEVTGYYIS